MEIILGIRGILRLGLLFFIIGLVAEYFAKDHWLDFMIYTPVWIVPVWAYMIPIGLFSAYLLLFGGGHHD